MSYFLICKYYIVAEHPYQALIGILQQINWQKDKVTIILKIELPGIHSRLLGDIVCIKDEKC